MNFVILNSIWLDYHTLGLKNGMIKSMMSNTAAIKMENPEL